MDFWEKGRTERKGYTWQDEGVLGDVQVRLVGTEWDEGRTPGGSQVRWVTH